MDSTEYTVLYKVTCRVLGKSYKQLLTYTYVKQQHGKRMGSLSHSTINNTAYC